MLSLLAAILFAIGFVLELLGATDVQTLLLWGGLFFLALAHSAVVTSRMGPRW